MEIWVDADGCPVVQLTINIAKKYCIPVTIVKNYAVVIDSNYAKVITVDVENDAADYKIIKNMAKDDLVITQDMGLAAMVLSKKGLCLTSNGEWITSENIDFKLMTRHEHKKLRKSGHYHGRIPKRQPADDIKFEEALNQFVLKI